MEIDSNSSSSTSPSSLEFLFLPEELIIRILSFLTPEQLRVCSLVCSSLHLLSNDPTLWRGFCRSLFNWSDEEIASLCVRTPRIAFKVLRRFGFLPGIWNSTTTPWGEFLEIKRQGPIFLGKRLSRWRKTPFEILISEDGEATLNIFKFTPSSVSPSASASASSASSTSSTTTSSSSAFSSSPSSSSSSSSPSSSSSSSSLPTRSLKCVHKILSCVSSDSFRLNLRPKAEKGENRRHTTENLIKEKEKEEGPTLQKKAKKMKRRVENDSLLFTRLKIGSFTPEEKEEDAGREGKEAGIETSKAERKTHKFVRGLCGLWKGVYGTHGTEILNVSLIGNKFLGTKVTGDANVPAGEISFTADIVENAVVTEVPLPGSNEHQLFRLIPGLGRVAERGFCNPKWLRGYLLVNEKESLKFRFQWQPYRFAIFFSPFSLELDWEHPTSGYFGLAEEDDEEAVEEVEDEEVGVTMVGLQGDEEGEGEREEEGVEEEEVDEILERLWGEM